MQCHKVFAVSASVRSIPAGSGILSSGTVTVSSMQPHRTTRSFRPSPRRCNRVTRGDSTNARKMASAIGMTNCCARYMTATTVMVTTVTDSAMSARYRSVPMKTPSRA